MLSMLRSQGIESRVTPSSWAQSPGPLPPGGGLPSPAAMAPLPLSLPLFSCSTVGVQNSVPITQIPLFRRQSKLTRLSQWVSRPAALWFVLPPRALFFRARTGGLYVTHLGLHRYLCILPIALFSLSGILATVLAPSFSYPVFRPLLVPQGLRFFASGYGEYLGIIWVMGYGL